MKLHRYLIVIAAVLAMPLAAFAQSRAMAECNSITDPAQASFCKMQNADCSTPEWLPEADRASCAAEEGNKQEKAIRYQRAQLVKLMSPKERSLLTVADDAFTRFARAQCAVESEHFSGGSMHSIAMGYCLQRLADTRSQQYTDVEFYFKARGN